MYITPMRIENPVSRDPQFAGKLDILCGLCLTRPKGDSTFKKDQIQLLESRGRDYPDEALVVSRLIRQCDEVCFPKRLENNLDSITARYSCLWNA